MCRSCLAPEFVMRRIWCSHWPENIDGVFLPVPGFWQTEDSPQCSGSLSLVAVKPPTVKSQAALGRDSSNSPDTRRRPSELKQKRDGPGKCPCFACGLFPSFGDINASFAAIYTQMQVIFSKEKDQRLSLSGSHKTHSFGPFLCFLW